MVAIVLSVIGLCRFMDLPKKARLPVENLSNAYCPEYNKRPKFRGLQSE